MSQVIIQTHLARLKQTIVDLEQKIVNLEANQNGASEEEGHAHYHGDVKCTHDHGHDEQSHEEPNKKEETHKEGHDHGHKHDHHEDHHSHGHDHENGNQREDHHHEHQHQHCDQKEDDIPEWKKKALNADPNAAPFGGSWNAESSVDATMEDTHG